MDTTMGEALLRYGPLPAALALGGAGLWRAAPAVFERLFGEADRTRGGRAGLVTRLVEQHLALVERVGANVAAQTDTLRAAGEQLRAVAADAAAARGAAESGRAETHAALLRLADALEAVAADKRLDASRPAADIRRLARASAPEGR
jgi:hypothetical protein